MTVRKALGGMLREPLVHFLIAGFMLFVFFAWRGSEVDPESRTITVSEPQVTKLVAGWQQTWQRPPTPQELDGLIRDHIREEVLYREGLRLGLDKDDTVVRRRIRSKMEFLVDARTEAQLPDDAQLQVWLDRNPQKYAAETLYSLDQIYIGGNDAAAAARRARKMADDLRRGADWEGLGDAISLPRSVENETRDRLAAGFGSAFVDALDGLKLPQGQWSPPLASGFGLHLVRLRKRESSGKPRLADVREQVANDWRAQTKTRRGDQAYQTLLDHYTIRIDKP